MTLWNYANTFTILMILLFSIHCNTFTFTILMILFLFIHLFIYISLHFLNILMISTILAILHFIFWRYLFVFVFFCYLPIIFGHKSKIFWLLRPPSAAGMSNVEKRFLKLFCKLPGAIMGQNRRSGRIWGALESHHNFFWTRHFLDRHVHAHQPAQAFWPGKFVFFRNDHFYSQKVTPFRALRADSWVDFLSWFFFCWHGNKVY